MLSEAISIISSSYHENQLLHTFYVILTYNYLGSEMIGE